MPRLEDIFVTEANDDISNNTNDASPTSNRSLTSLAHRDA